MIRVNVKDYCSDCLDFEPDVEKPHVLYSGTDKVFVGDTIIRCKYRDRCEQMKRYLEKKMADDGFVRKENISCLEKN